MRPIKVYFECTGGESEYHWIEAYVAPTGYGEAFQYNSDGKRYRFSWVEEEKAKVVMSSELPKEMWYSIRHGVHHFKQKHPKGEAILENKDIDIPNLIYRKREPQEVSKYKIAKEIAKKISTIEEFKAEYPKIKGLGIVPVELFRKIAELAGYNQFNIPRCGYFVWLPYDKIFKEWGLEP